MQNGAGPELGPIDQVAYVVEDMERALPGYEALYGPFRVAEAPLPGCRFRDRTIDELSALTQVSSRTIRFYQAKGALPRPTIRGRVAFYDDTHVERLKLIAELQDRGLRIKAIKDLVQKLDRGELEGHVPLHVASPPWQRTDFCSWGWSVVRAPIWWTRTPKAARCWRTPRAPRGAFRSWV